MKRPDLANTFSIISQNGKKGFYEGEIAERFIEAMNLNDGFFTLEDFKNYETSIKSPIVGSYRNKLVLLQDHLQVEVLFF